MTRQGSGFSKKFESCRDCLALRPHNFVRMHEILRMTPAMFLGITEGADCQAIENSRHICARCKLPKVPFTPWWNRRKRRGWAAYHENKDKQQD
jgi:hypothetical protein